MIGWPSKIWVSHRSVALLGMNCSARDCFPSSLCTWVVLSNGMWVVGMCIISRLRWLGSKYRNIHALPLPHLAAGWCQFNLEHTSRWIQHESPLRGEPFSRVDFPWARRFIMLSHWDVGCLLRHLALLTLTNVGTMTGFWVECWTPQSSHLGMLALEAKCRVKSLLQCSGSKETMA